MPSEHYRTDVGLWDLQLETGWSDKELIKIHFDDSKYLYVSRAAYIDGARPDEDSLPEELVDMRRIYGGGDLVIPRRCYVPDKTLSLPYVGHRLEVQLVQEDSGHEVYYQTHCRIASFEVRFRLGARSINHLGGTVFETSLDTVSTA